MTDIGTLGGTHSFGSGINDDGDVVGRAQLTGNTAYHAFLYSAGIMQDLGVLATGNNSEAYAVNASGQVVGRSETALGHRAFLYDNGQMIDLNSLLDLSDPDANSLVLSQAQDINDSGQIVAYGCGQFGVCGSYLLTLAPDEFVPEPASLAIFGAGMGGVAWLHRRKTA